jgi:hypothetical protein
MISVERGWERWQAMRTATTPADELGDSRYRVRLTARPPDVPSGESDYNEAWNLRTLSIMARADMIRFDGEVPPRPAEDASADTQERDEELTDRFEDFVSSAVVSLEQGDLTRANWERRFSDVRAHTADQNRRSLQLMMEVLDPKRCLGELFAETYAINAGPSGPVYPAPSCGGCPVCRSSGRHPYSLGSPVPRPVTDPIAWTSLQLEELASNRVVLVTVAPHRRDTERRIDDLVKRLVPMGIRQIVADARWLERASVREADILGPERYVFVARELDPSTPRVPTLCITELTEAEDPVEPSDLAAGSIPLKVVVLSDSRRDPGKPLPVSQLHPTYGLDEFLARI